MLTSCEWGTGAAAERWRGDAAAAAEGTIPDIKMMTLDVLVAPGDGSDRCNLLFAMSRAWLLILVYCNSQRYMLR